MKKRIFLFTATLFFVSTQLFAQDAVVKKDTSYWKTGKQFGFNFSSAGFGKWSAGGQDAIGVNLFFNTKGEYARDKTTWVNDLQLQLGFLNNGSGTRKSIDRIFFDTKVGRKLSKTWSLVGGLNFQSQFAKGYEYGGGAKGEDLYISNLFSPAFITEYIGLEWKPKPFFNVVFAPGALRQTIISEDVRRFDKNNKPIATFGVPVNSTFQNDVGIMQIVATFDKDIAKNMNLKMRYQLFMDANKIAHMDNRLDVKLAAKINKYFSATFDLIAVYDDDQNITNPDTKETTQNYNIQTAYNLGLGFLYTF
jgi:Protein of unknown function (DUF3078)